jgi:plastocyanin
MFVNASAWAAAAPGIPKTVEVTVGPGGSPVYDPSAAWLRMGGTVTWTWASDDHTVTDSSPLGLFDSGVQGTGDTFSYTPVAASTYTYESTTDPGMTGKIKVPMKVFPRTGDSSTVFTLTWAVGEVPNAYFKVKGRFNGHQWFNYHDGLGFSFSRTFNPGTWEFRARVYDSDTGENTMYSPILTFIVSP